MKFILLTLAAFSVNAFAANRECRAILIGPSSEATQCLYADEQLEAVFGDGASWNSIVCNQGVRAIEFNNLKFQRDQESGNLLMDGCEWEVRANSGGAQ